MSRQNRRSAERSGWCGTAISSSSTWPSGDSTCASRLMSSPAGAPRGRPTSPGSNAATAVCTSSTSSRRRTARTSTSWRAVRDRTCGPTCRRGSRAASEPAGGEKRPIGALVVGRLGEPGGVGGEDVLLDDEPPAEADLGSGPQHAVDVDVALAQAREHLARPDRRGRFAGGDDLCEAVQADVLEVEVVDAGAPPSEERDRVAATDRQVTGVEAEPNVRAGEDLLDLPGCLDIGARLIVEGRL